MLTNAINTMKGWLSQPFNTQQSLLGWVFVVGIFLVLVILWTRVLSHVIEGVTTSVKEVVT